MYEKFFGFTERPFQLVPNPAYMFFSRSHEEALAHLTYAVTQGDGFVEITGEVGTGKTTLCRVFLDSLGDEVDAAYIFNPMLTAVELLKAINDEFGIASDADGTKALIDELNRFLIQRRRDGKKVLLLIDEAQNLNRDVLEQLRLLSNLETNTSKLLQIILVGQPELRELLDSHDLRQLRQRITLSCHLTPLNFPETVAYIQHRIRIASRREPVTFSRSAAAAVYRYSGGTPRRINIVCDRSMLTAFSHNKQKISGGIARAAVRELTPKGDAARNRIPVSGFLAPIAAMLIIVTVGLFLFHTRSDSGSDVQGDANSGAAVGDVSAGNAPSANTGLTASESLPPVDVSAESPPEAGGAADPSSAASTPISAGFDKSPSGFSPPPPAVPADAADSALSGKGQPAEAGQSIESAVASEGMADPVMALTEASEKNTPDGASSVAGGQADAPHPPVGTAYAVSAFPSGNLPAFVDQASVKESRRDAMEWVIRQWGQEALLKDGLDQIPKSRDYFLLASRQNGFSLHQIDGNFDMIRNLNLPAIMELYDEEGTRPVYLAVSALAPDHVVLTNGKKQFKTDFDTLSDHWAGAAYIPWKDFYGLAGIIPRNAPKESVITLKMMLQEIGFTRISIDSSFDEATSEAVRLIQRRNGVGVDGTVGPVTKMILYNEISSLKIPHIRG